MDPKPTSGLGPIINHLSGLSPSPISPSLLLSLKISSGCMLGQVLVSSMRLFASEGGRMVECENLSPPQPPRTRTQESLLLVWLRTLFGWGSLLLFSALSIRRNHICCDEFEKNSIKTVNARVLAGQTISLSGTYYRIRLAVVFRMLESLLGLYDCLDLCYFFSALSIRRNHICCDEFEKNSIKTVNARVLAGQTISLSGTYYRIRLAVVFRMLESLLGLYDCLDLLGLLRQGKSNKLPSVRNNKLISQGKDIIFSSLTLILMFFTCKCVIVLLREKKKQQVESQDHQLAKLKNSNEQRLITDSSENNIHLTESE
ncbi:hypothetical protein Tco_0583502 [Tanacetum coccineum]